MESTKFEMSASGSFCAPPLVHMSARLNLAAAWATEGEGEEEGERTTGIYRYLCNKLKKEGSFHFAPNFGFKHEILRPRFRWVSLRTCELANLQRAVKLTRALRACR
jgi:hypothetical protein